MRDFPRRPRSFVLLLLVLAALLVAAAACGGDEEAAEPAPPAETAAAEPAPPPAPEPTPPEPAEPPPAEPPPAEPPALEPATINVALDWFPNPDHVSLYYALENGFFDEQALTVKFKTPSDPSAGLKLVATNKFGLAIFYQGDMFFAAEEGLPVIAVGSLIPTPLNSMIALSDSKVQGPDTIKGATIGVAGLPFDDAILQAMRQQQGLAEDDVKKVNVGFDLVPALLTKKADAVIGAYWNIEGNVLKLETGVDPVIIRLEDIGVPHYDELIIVANKERLASDPGYADAVKRFLAGVVKGAEAAAADAAGAVEVIKSNTEYKAEEIELMVPTTVGLLSPPSGQPIGCFDIDGWQAFGQWMSDNKLLKGTVDATTIVTNDYLPNPC